MRHAQGFMAALVLGGAVGILGMTGMSLGQVIVNPGWESPTNTTDSTTETVDGWTMEQDHTATGGLGNTGKRATFFGSADPGRWSFWIQDFQFSGDAYQVVSGITPGLEYQFTSQMDFQLGSGSTIGATYGYNSVTGMYSYVAMQYLDSGGNAIGGQLETDIPSGSISAANLTGNLTPWMPFSVSGVAPAGAASVKLLIGWSGGAGGTGSQSAGADGATLTVVPEPACIGMLAIGGLALLGRRRKLA